MKGVTVRSMNVEHRGEGIQDVGLEVPLIRRCGCVGRRFALVPQYP